MYNKFLIIMSFMLLLSGAPGRAEEVLALNPVGADGAALDFAYPSALTQDAAGNLYIADTFRHRIVKLTPDGELSVVAGDGTRGFSGDGGPATQAQLHYPGGLAFDSARDLLYIADTENQRIRTVDAQGIIRTIAGQSLRAYGGDGGPASAAAFDTPKALALDSSGRLYIADTFNYCVRRIDQDGVIDTVAGGGGVLADRDDRPATSVQLGIPTALALDARDRLYIASGHYLIRYLDERGYIYTLLGTGVEGDSSDGTPPAEAALGMVYGLALDAAGNLFFADDTHRKLRLLTADGVLLTLDDSLQAPRALLLDAKRERLYILDYQQQRLFQLSRNRLPQADFSVSPAQGGRPLDVTLDASDARDPDGEALHYEWLLPAYAHPLTGLVQQVRLHSPGTHTVTLRVTDERGGQATQSLNLELFDTPAESAPQALFSLARRPDASGGLLIDAFAHPVTAPESIRYQWHSSDGQQAQGAQAQFHFQHPGAYNLSLSLSQAGAPYAEQTRTLYVGPSCSGQAAFNPASGRLHLPRVKVLDATGELLGLYRAELDWRADLNALLLRDAQALSATPTADECAAEYSPAGLHVPRVDIPLTTDGDAPPIAYRARLRQLPGVMQFEIMELTALEQP